MPQYRTRGALTAHRLRPRTRLPSRGRQTSADGSGRIQASSGGIARRWRRRWSRMATSLNSLQIIWVNSMRPQRSPQQAFWKPCEHLCQTEPDGFHPSVGAPVSRPVLIGGIFDLTRQPAARIGSTRVSDRVEVLPMLAGVCRPACRTPFLRRSQVRRASKPLPKRPPTHRTGLRIPREAGGYISED